MAKSADGRHGVSASEMVEADAIYPECSGLGHVQVCCVREVCEMRASWKSGSQAGGRERDWKASGRKDWLFDFAPFIPPLSAMAVREEYDLAAICSNKYLPSSAAAIQDTKTTLREQLVGRSGAAASGLHIYTTPACRHTKTCFETRDDCAWRQSSRVSSFTVTANVHAARTRAVPAGCGGVVMNQEKERCGRKCRSTSSLSRC